jgi:invasion protein IalB
MRSDSFSRRLPSSAVAAALAVLASLPSALAQEGIGGWRVECTSDGKALDCRAVQQMVNRDDKQLVAQLTARVAPDTKAPMLTIQLPLGISLTEPVQLKVDNGPVERQPVQTCTNAGCIVAMPLKDPFLASLRGGTTLKITLQDPNKRTIAIDVPLLGFGLAFDKATK